MGTLKPASGGSASRLAVVGPGNQLHLIGPQGEDPVQLTIPLPRNGVWGAVGQTQEFWSWPTWSPDGTRIAALCAQSSDRVAGPVRVICLHTDGVRQEEWAQLHDSLPLYLHWHPSGEHIGMIQQQGEELQLSVISRGRMGAVRPVESGVPIFFAWEPPQDPAEQTERLRMLVHVGGRRTRTGRSGRTPGEPRAGEGREGEGRAGEFRSGRLLWRDPLGTSEDLPLLQVPGNFCAPIFCGGQAIISLSGEDGSSIHRLIDDQPGPALDLREGLVAMLPSPDGRWLAITSSPEGEGNPYQGLDLLDMDDEEPQPLPLTPSSMLAFFWSPDGRFLIYVVVDREQNCLQWFRLGTDGGLRSLGSFWPTRDMLFYLHFFDQYATSHPLISADGRWLCYAGYPAGGGHADLSGSARIYVQDLLRPDRPAEELCEGSFAVFSPVQDGNS